MHLLKTNKDGYDNSHCISEGSDFFYVVLYSLCHMLLYWYMLSDDRVTKDDSTDH